MCKNKVLYKNVIEYVLELKFDVPLVVFFIKNHCTYYDINLKLTRVKRFAVHYVSLLHSKSKITYYYGVGVLIYLQAA